MLQIMCMLNTEDYRNLRQMESENVPLNYYGYMFEVEGGPEETGGKGLVKLMVLEFLNAKLAVGFAVRPELTIEGEFQIKFIGREDPSQEIPVVCKLSGEVKRTQYMGDDQEKLEYIGFSLEKFYQGKDATFYMYDLRQSLKEQNIDAGAGEGS